VVKVIEISTNKIGQYYNMIPLFPNPPSDGRRHLTIDIKWSLFITC